jgi:ADP-ribosyl-[dinitrogen reductase] hydrolase
MTANPASLQQTNTLAPLTFGALGDAYGFGFEFTKAEFVRAHNTLEYQQHPHFSNPRGVYSDDTQMQMALAEIIAAKRDWTPKEIADSFVHVFKRDQRPGYASRFHNLLLDINSGDELRARINPDSERNGAAMRAPIVGLFSDLSKVVTFSEVQAKITHDTRAGVDSAVAAALLAHYFAYNHGSKDEAAAFLRQHVPGYDWEAPWTEPVEVNGIQTVRAALTAITKSQSLADLLKTCVDFTGDVDSVATIALSSASCSAQFTRDLPQALWDGIEDGKFGIRYLVELDARVRAVTIEAAVR